MVPKLKNSASSAILSAKSAALGISIIVPTSYFKSIPDSFIIASAVWQTMFLTYFNSFTSPTRGIIISGVTSIPFLDTLIAASITALVCILAISG